LVYWRRRGTNKQKELEGGELTIGAALGNIALLGGIIAG